ncbi:hypothetical protein QSV36_03115 [Pseudomonas sp. BCRC 81390]|uniref:hypothetical protein n=1 Tax=Pseudomonas sp. BCRC 81390 TaxID=3054778 RepID=UPI0025945599|nr:hypothetical protein [Pseudomonas sp. BCRC 81390]MDM3884588.1 hypothetical protein [Pseudomonas sp. BCRC 81390]
MDKAVEQLMLIGGTALLYPTGIGEIQRQAAFDSILYAQLVANRNVGSRFDDYQGWYRAYREAYRQLGWIKLANTHDCKQLGQPSRSTQIQPLEAWLRVRSIRQEAVWAALKAGLGLSIESFDHLLKFTAQGADLVIELGLLKPGPVLELCSITLQFDRPIAAIPQDSLLGEQAFKGQAEFNGVSLILDNGRFQAHREELQALMKSKDAQKGYRLDPYAMARSAS